MVNVALVTKVTGGVAAGSATIGTGVYGYYNGWMDGFLNRSVPFLIVKTTAVTPNPSIDVFPENYTCSFSDKNDEKCKIEKLTDKDKFLAVALKNVVSKDVDLTNLKAADNFYKIFVSKDVFDAIDGWDDDQKLISISKTKEKTATEATESIVFSKVKPIYGIRNNRIVKRKHSYLFTFVQKATPGLQTLSQDKKYLCKVGNSFFDCLISPITFTDNKKHLNKNDLITQTTAISDFSKLNEKDNFFKVQVPEEFINNSLVNKENIAIVDAQNVNTSYANLSPIFSLIDETTSSFSKKDFWVVKAEDPTGTEVESDFSKYTQCSVEGNKNTYACNIYKFDPAVTAFENIAFTKAATAITQTNDLTKDSIFVVKFTFDKKYRDNIIQNNSKIIFKSENGNKKEYPLSVKAKIFGDPSTADNERRIFVI